MLLESLEGKLGHVQILSNTGTRENPGCVSIWSDSMNALQNSKKEWVSDKLRHIKTAYHFFKQYVKWGDLRLGHVAGPENCADIFTKALARPTFEIHRKSLLEGITLDLINGASTEGGS
jgi:hypothetical protein